MVMMVVIEASVAASVDRDIATRTDADVVATVAEEFPRAVVAGSIGKEDTIALSTDDVGDWRVIDCDEAVIATEELVRGSEHTGSMKGRFGLLMNELVTMSGGDNDGVSRRRCCRGLL